MGTYGALFNNTFFSPTTRYRITPRATGRKFEHAKRYTNAITRETCDTSFAQYLRFSSLGFRETGQKYERLISFINRLSYDDAFFLSRKKINKFRCTNLDLTSQKKNCRAAFSSFLATKEGCTLPSRRVDLGTHGHGTTLLYTHMHVRTCHIPVVSEHPLARKSCRRRNLLGRLSELSLVSPAASRAPDVFPAHDRKYFLFVRVHGTSSIRLPLKSRCAGSAFRRALFTLKGFRKCMRIEGQ